tara:strand:+ start:4993 stop:5325 length:333 start_codon:yes stop_codon:yes gene_type:complete
MAGGLQKYTVQEAQNASLGQAGSIFVSGTSAVSCKSGVFVAITFLENTVFDNAGLKAEDDELYPDDTGTSGLIGTNGAAIDGETFPKGVTIYGRWTSFTLTSGLVIAYRG